MLDQTRAARARSAPPRSSTTCGGASRGSRSSARGARLIHMCAWHSTKSTRHKFYAQRAPYHQITWFRKFAHFHKFRQLTFNGSRLHFLTLDLSRRARARWAGVSSSPGRRKHRPSALARVGTNPGPWFILYWKKALGNPYKIAVQDIEKVTSSSLRVLPNLVGWYFEYLII